MTFVEMLNYVVENVENEEVKAIAKARIEREQKANETRKNYVAKKNAAKEEAKAVLREKAIAVLGTEPKTATEIVEALAAQGETITRQAIPHLFKPALEEGKVAKDTVVIEGEKSKTKAVGYKLA